jgi:hypothetical protein
MKPSTRSEVRWRGWQLEDIASCLVLRCSDGQFRFMLTLNGS